MVGDTNARLGPLLDDRSIHGRHTTNSNCPLFRDFLDFTGLTILNRIFCSGVPTYEIVNRKRSIIDLCLTNFPQTVANLVIERTTLGANCLTCHKPLTLSIFLPPPFRNSSKKAVRRVFFAYPSVKRQISLTRHNACALTQLFGVGSPDNHLMTKVFF